MKTTPFHLPNQAGIGHTVLKTKPPLSTRKQLEIFNRRPFYMHLTGERQEWHKQRPFLASHGSFAVDKPPQNWNKDGEK
jgi:hypothetical protein